MIGIVGFLDALANKEIAVGVVYAEITGSFQETSLLGDLMLS